MKKASVYATVSDLRAEGVAEAVATDARLKALLVEASVFIDWVTGQFFEPRSLVLTLDGRGTPTIELPVPPIRLDRLFIYGIEVLADDDHLTIVGAPVRPDFDTPRLILHQGGVFPRGSGNVEARGVWGYTEPDATETGRTPLEIRRVAMLLAMRNIPALGRGDAADAHNRWRAIEERSGDPDDTLSRMVNSDEFTGDPEIDTVLARYRGPARLGMVFNKGGSR